MHIYNIKTSSISHASVIISIGFDTFTQQFEQLARLVDPGITQAIMDEKTLSAIAKTEDDERLVIFDKQNHGALFVTQGESRQAYRYYIDCPFITLSMTKLDIRTGRYNPLVVFIYEIDKNAVAIEFDLPTSLFGQFGNKEIIEAGELLNTKLLRLIDKTVKAASAS